MESSSYTLLSLMVGRLPWETRKQQRLSSRRMFSLKKQWSGAQLDGDLSLFGSFVDYTRSMAYTEEPAYLCWRDRFRALVPGLSADPLYDPSDCSSPLLNAMITNVDCQRRPTASKMEMIPEEIPCRKSRTAPLHRAHCRSQMAPRDIG